MNKITPKYQVFISSTHDDLIEERQAVIKEILALNCIPVAMEFFQPTDESLNIITRALKDCDYVVLIVAGRYGSIIKGKSISFTEAEYKYASDEGIPVIPFLVNDKKLNTFRKSKKRADRKKIEKTKLGQKRLSYFRKEIKEKHHVGFFETEKDLPSLVANALHDAINNMKRPGWVRNDQYSKWNIIYSAIEKNNLEQTPHSEIKPLFQQAQGMQTILPVFPLIKQLAGKNEKDIRRFLKQRRRTTIIKNALASSIYERNLVANTIELNLQWVSCDLVYAICHVLENSLHTSRGFSANSFSNKPWWKSPWDNILLYISQICSDKGLTTIVTQLLHDVSKQSEKTRSACLELIYRMVTTRSSVEIKLLNRVIREILYF